jgi:hypothetical protein
MDFIIGLLACQNNEMMHPEQGFLTFFGGTPIIKEETTFTT